MLPVPSEYSGVHFLEWPEDVDPYKVASTVLKDTAGTIFVDNSIRKFIVDGLQRVLPAMTIASAPDMITQLRERKSDTEIEILKCSNEVPALTRSPYPRD